MLDFIWFVIFYIGKTGMSDSAGSTAGGCESNNNHIRINEMVKTTNYTVSSYNNGNIDV